MFDLEGLQLPTGGLSFRQTAGEAALAARLGGRFGSCTPLAMASTAITARNISARVVPLARAVA